MHDKQVTSMFQMHSVTPHPLTLLQWVLKGNIEETGRCYVYKMLINLLTQLLFLSSLNSP